MNVIAVGGSVIKQNFEELEKFTEELEKNEPLIAVVGAGHLKKHQDAVRDKCSKAGTDMVGIAATRLNAETVKALMENAHPSVPETVEEVQEAASTGRNVVMGGLNPGFSTDAVAAILAELFEADLYLATDVDGIYTADPSEDDDAEKLESIAADRLLDMTEGKNEPGVYSIVDETAVNIIRRSGIKTKVFHGTIENIGSPEEADGTVVNSWLQEVF